TVVEDQRVPVGVKAAPRIGVLVEVGAVEVAEAVLVAGEVRGHPVEKDADPLLMQVVDQVHEVLRLAKARGWREVAGDLISPGSVKRMLGDRHELDVSKAVVAYVSGE